ncbi:GNAT family N-acetyltransferase [Devosia oryziradicis]|uniref:GNAT family N-acetyltransferase n=1 Tax=Devosia oryziradicis TaxID=2801335 RepID=A0ABX7BT98_9HYPH|nr:GNAT family N-acetyltransferase [Devosia oryziradicis]
MLLIDGEVAGRGFSEIPEDGRWHIGETGTTESIPTGSMLLTGFTTNREFRRRGVYVALMSHILAEFFSQGGSEAFIGSLTLNTASRRAIEKLGFSAFGVHRAV